MRFPRNKYRIVRDNYAGYEVQIKRWWLPLWYQVCFTNTHFSIEEAKKFAALHAAGKCKAVSYLGELP